MTARKSSVRVEDVNLPDDGPTYDQPTDAPIDSRDEPPSPERSPGNETGSIKAEAKGSQPAPSPSQAMVGHHQLRVISSLLNQHGIRTDAAVYDWLTLRLGREMTSRKDITATEAAHIIADLESAPVEVGGPEVWAALAAPFPPEEVEKLPKVLNGRDEDKGWCNPGTRYSADGYHCGSRHARAIHLDYVGHAGITMRLNEVVTPAGWSWEPVAWNPDGTPNVGREFWIRLTVLGVTRYGVGDDFGGSGKQAIGDALRNAAMRFGIGTYLWSKSEAALAMKQATDDHPEPRNETPTNLQSHAQETEIVDDLTGLDTQALLLILDGIFSEAGKSFEEGTARWRQQLGGVDVAYLDSMDPEHVAGYVRQVRAFLAAQGGTA